MLTTRPNDSRLRFGLAVEYLNAGELKKGAEALRGYLAIADDEGNGWARLGVVLVELGRIEEARDAYRKGVGAARRHGHPTLAEELSAALEALA